MSFILKKIELKEKNIEKKGGVPIHITLHICQLQVTIDYQAGYQIKA